MANQEQNPPQQEQPFVAAKQVGFNLEDILLNTNNEVALLYPEHNNKDYFKCVSNFISKYCLRKPFTKSPNMYKEHLAVFWYSAKALENSKVFPSQSPLVEFLEKQWFLMIGYEEEVLAKGTLKKSLLPPRRSLANGINIVYANIFKEDIIIKLKKKQREKVVPYTRFLSLLIMHKMKEGYRDDEVTLYLTQVFMVFKAPKTSSKAESISQGTKPGAQTGHKKPLTSSKQPSVSNKEATNGGSFKAPTSSKIGHSKKRKKSSSAMDSNLSQPLVSTPVDTGIHKEDQQATGGPTSLGVTNETRTNPQLSSGMSTFKLNEPVYSASFIIHFGSASGNDASAASTVEADPKNSAPSDFEETSSIIKLEDLVKLVSDVQPSFKDLDSPEDDPGIIVNDSNEDKDYEVHATENGETKDTSVPKSSSPKSTQVQELTN
ncbi:hypothetical protein Tco_0972073 [Tanacetum coccineum]